MRRIVLFMIAAAVCTAIPRASPAQQGAYRFEISAVGDSTISFRVGDVPWVKAGMTGIAVDPSHHDALIARMSVLRVSGSLATAVVTGQTARITTDFVALLEPPSKKWYQQPMVWVGTGVGLILGIVIAH
jgi:hypothetical protein